MSAAVILASVVSAGSAVAQSRADQSPARIDNSRILLAGGAITEIVYALGLADKVVAVDSTSQFPLEALKTKKNVGYFRALSTEGVLSVNPSVIIASDKAGPPEVVKALKASSIPYVEIDDRPDPAALSIRVRKIAGILQQTERGETLVRSVESDFDALATARQTIKAPRRALFILSVQNGRAVVGGRETSADVMLRLAGAVNCGAAFDGFKPVTEEGLIEMAPDVIVVMTQSNGHSVRDAVTKLSAFQGSPAGRRDSIVEMDGLYILGFGPRAPAAARDLMRAIYSSSEDSRRGAGR